MTKKPRRGISPVIATVIIVAVAIAIAIAVAGWLFGLWGGFAGGTTQVEISNVKVYEDASNNVIAELYIINGGSGSDKILKVELTVGSNTDDTIDSVTVSGTGLQNNPDNTVDIQANAKGWVTINFGTDLTVNPGDSVTIRVYLEKSGTVTIPTTVQP